MRSTTFGLLLVLGLTASGCGGGTDKPASTAEEEQQLKQQIEQSRRAEGGAQTQSQ